ncbi:MAG: ankyrin repeat domain-containing protein [Gammaproteobacteria bacterium]|nr:ankyrin repeat domain-containing protein [Gammaproteobacteria bacterium]
MQRKITERPFSQEIFIQRYKNILGKDALKAIKKHNGLCQAMCILIALYGHKSPLINTFFAAGYIDPIESRLSHKPLEEFQQATQPDQKNQHIKHLINIIEEIAIKAHPITNISFLEKIKRVRTNAFSYAPKIYDDKESLIEYKMHRFTINKKTLKNILTNIGDNHYLQLSFLNKPKFSNAFSLSGHATLIFKSENEFHFFDPNKILFSSNDINALINEVNASLAFTWFQPASSIVANLIDLNAFLKDYKGEEWLARLPKPHVVLDEKQISPWNMEDKSQWLNPQLSLAIRHFCPKDYGIIYGLLKYKANPNIICSENNDTPLHIATTIKNSTHVIQLLIENKADINKTNKQGKTPLHLMEENTTSDALNEESKLIFQLLNSTLEKEENEKKLCMQKTSESSNNSFDSSQSSAQIERPVNRLNPPNLLK